MCHDIHELKEVAGNFHLWRVKAHLDKNSKTSRCSEQDKSKAKKSENRIWTFKTHITGKNTDSSFFCPTNLSLIHLEETFWHSHCRIMWSFTSITFFRFSLSVFGLKKKVLNLLNQLQKHEKIKRRQSAVYFRDHTIFFIFLNQTVGLVYQRKNFKEV